VLNTKIVANYNIFCKVTCVQEAIEVFAGIVTEDISVEEHNKTFAATPWPIHNY